MGKAIHVSGAENKAAAQLEWVSAKLVLGMTCGFGTGAGLGIVASEQMKQVRALEFHCRIGFALFVNKEGEGNARFFAESACIDAISKSHGSQVGATIAEDVLARAQLRDVLAAEDSTVMAQENHNGGPTEP